MKPCACRSGMQDINRPYLNYLLPLFQNEVWCSTIRMKLSLVYKWMKTSNHLKGLEPGLALKMRPMVIRKWPIRYYWCFPPRLPSSDGTCFTVNPRKHLSWLWLHLNFKKLLITALTCHSTPKLAGIWSFWTSQKLTKWEFWTSGHSNTPSERSEGEEIGYSLGTIETAEFTKKKYTRLQFQSGW